MLSTKVVTRGPLISAESSLHAENAEQAGVTHRLLARTAATRRFARARVCMWQVSGKAVMAYLSLFEARVMKHANPFAQADTNCKSTQ